MYNMREILRIIRQRKERDARRLAFEKSKAEAKALALINRYKDLYDLFSDAIYLGQIRGLDRALGYVMDVRKVNYLAEKISWPERSELFRLAARQRI